MKTKDRCEPNSAVIDQFCRRGINCPQIYQTKEGNLVVIGHQVENEEILSSLSRLAGNGEAVMILPSGSLHQHGQSGDKPREVIIDSALCLP